MTNVAFCGLGVMGYPMAGHLHAAGHQVAVYNRTGVQGRRLGGGHSGWAIRGHAAGRGDRR